MTFLNKSIYKSQLTHLEVFPYIIIIHISQKHEKTYLEYRALPSHPTCLHNQPNLVSTTTAVSVCDCL